MFISHLTLKVLKHQYISIKKTKSPFLIETTTWLDTHSNFSFSLSAKLFALAKDC